MKKSILHKLGLLGLLMLVIAACDKIPPPGPQCVSAADFGDINALTITVPANSGAWINTNINVLKDNSEVHIDVKPGAMLLCGNETDVPINVDSKNENWTATGIQVAKDDQLYISVNQSVPGVYTGPGAGKYNRWGDSSDPVCSSPNQSKCWMVDGMGLNAKVGGVSEANKCNINSCQPGNIVLPDGGTSLPASGLWQYSGLPLDTSILSSVPSELFLRVWDSVSDYSDNEGGYVASITHYGCPKYNGENLRAYIGKDTPDPSRSVDDTIDLGPDSTSYRQTSTAEQSGTIWLKIYDLNSSDPGYAQASGDGNFGNNAGQYEVTITVVTHPKTVSTAINWLVDGVKAQLTEAREAVYRGIITTQFARIVRAMLALYIVLYGIAFVYGMISQPQIDFIIRIVKIAVIIQLISPGSWDFFNTYLFRIFTDGSSYLIHVMSNAYSAGPAVTSWTPDQPIEWTFLDQTFSQLFSQATWIKLAGLLFAFPLGLLYLVLIVMTMVAYVSAVAWVILTYLLSLVALSLLIAVAPIFISFLLFTKTAEMFKNWVNQIFSYALRPVVLIALMVIFNYFIVAALLRVLNYGVCWKCLWDAGGLCLWSFYTPVWPAIWVYNDPVATLPVTIIDILILLMLTKMLPKIIAYAEKTAAQLSSVPGRLNLTAIAKPQIDSLGDAMKATIGTDKDSQARRKQAKSDEETKQKDQKLRERIEKEVDSGKGGPPKGK